jgi:hypothetical protein
VRLAVALSLYLLRYEDEPGDKPGLEKSIILPDVTDWPAWKESMGLDKKQYKNLKRFYEIRFYDDDNLKADKKTVWYKETVWLVAKKIWGLHKWMNIEPDKEADDVKRSITTAMAGYRTTKGQEREGDEWEGKEWESVANLAFSFLDELKLETTSATNRLDLGADRIDENKESIVIDDIKNLLNRKRLHPEPLGYRELLELSFYDEDFLVFGGTGVTVYNIKKVGDTKYSYSSAVLKQSVTLITGSTAAEVTFTSDSAGTDVKKTTKRLWNSAQPTISNVAQNQIS